MNNYIKDVIFKDNSKRYQDLIDLSEKIKRMKISKRPYLIEFLGTARSGKTSSIELIADVFRKHGFNVLVVDEEKVNLTKEINQNRNKKLQIDSLDYTNKVIQEKIFLYDKTYQENVDIVIYDRGINDEFIWLNIFGANKDKIIEYDCRLVGKNVDSLIILTCDVCDSLKRKYFNSLSVLPNKWTNMEMITKYLDSIDIFLPFFKKHTNNIYKFDSTNKDKVDVALDIVNQIIDDIGIK